MNRLIARGLAVAFLLCLAAPLSAQDGISEEARSNIPVAPIAVRFQFMPQYFVQLITNDPRYGSIEALLDSNPERPWYEVILTERGTGKRIFYLNSAEAVNILRQTGTIAHYAQIDFTAAATSDSPPAYRIALRDSSNQEIVWRFIADPLVAESETRFAPPTGAPGFVLMHASRRSAAAKGTAVTIANVTSPADIPAPAGSRSSFPSRSFYATNLVIAELAPGTQFWTVYSLPRELREGENWTVHARGAHQRIFSIERASQNEIELLQVDEDNPFSPPARLEILRTANGFALRSILFERQSHTLRISFAPALPLPGRGEPIKTDVAFAIAEDNQTTIAAGKAVVLNTVDAGHILWQFLAPGWARATAFDSGVNVIR